MFLNVVFLAFFAVAEPKIAPPPYGPLGPTQEETWKFPVPPPGQSACFDAEGSSPAACVMRREDFDRLQAQILQLYGMVKTQNDLVARLKGQCQPGRGRDS